MTRASALGLGAVLLAMQAWVIASWVRASSAGVDQADAVRRFLDGFPFGLGRMGVTSVTWLSVLIGGVGLGMAATAARHATAGWRVAAIAISAAHAVVLIWLLFTMM